MVFIPHSILTDNAGVSKCGTLRQKFVGTSSTGSKMNYLSVPNVMLAVNCNMFYQTGSVVCADKSDVIQIKHYIENLTDCYILCLLTAFTSAEHFPADVYLACLKFFPSRLHVVTHMWNIPHIKLLKQKYEMQNINVFFIFLGPLQFHCDSETDSSRVTQ